VGVPFAGAHRASEDVAATGRVLEGMLAAFGLVGQSWDAIAERAEPGRWRWIGPTGHVEWRAGVPVFTFGRHRGRALDAVAAEEEGSYLSWILDGRFPPHVKRIARLALELDARALRRRLANAYGAPPPPDGPRPESEGAAGEARTPDDEAPARERDAPAPDARPVAPSGPPRPADDVFSPIVLFDGVCNLCEWFVRFVIRRDHRGRFRFASLQSEVAAGLLDPHPEARGTDSIVLLEGGRAHVKSAAALRILRGLGGAWTLFYALWLVPRPIRDVVYDLVARHRYRWFGRRDTCLIPTPDDRARFIDQG
jgi:predicted DCC family thiol-disulfide oxidoreductase YuxK